MKKTIQLITALALLVSLTAIQPAQAQINYGIKGGLNLANWGGEDVEDTEMRTGFHLGGFLELSLLGIVAVEGGAYFSQKGYQYDLGNDIAMENISTYIDVPVVAKFSPLPLIHFYAGPQASFLLNNTVKMNGESDSGTEGFSPVDLALVLGAGVNVPGGLRVTAGYDFGLTTLDEDGDFKAYNRVIKLTVGYKF